MKKLFITIFLVFALLSPMFAEEALGDSNLAAEPASPTKNTLENIKDRLYNTGNVYLGVSYASLDINNLSNRVFTDPMYGKGAHTAANGYAPSATVNYAASGSSVSLISPGVFLGFEFMPTEKMKLKTDVGLYNAGIGSMFEFYFGAFYTPINNDSLDVGVGIYLGVIDYSATLGRVECKGVDSKGNAYSGKIEYSGHTIEDGDGIYLSGTKALGLASFYTSFKMNDSSSIEAEVIFGVNDVNAEIGIGDDLLDFGSYSAWTDGYVKARIAFKHKINKF